MLRRLSALAIVALGCGSSSSSNVFSVGVQASGGGPLTLAAIGDTLQLSASPRDSAGHAVSGVAVTWASGNTSVATVDAAGLVTAVANGAANISATGNGVTGKATVTVAQAVASIAVAPPTATVEPGATAGFEADLADAHGHPVSGGAVTWSADPASVATISAAGVATGVAAGSATITAAAGGKSATAALTVAAPGPPPASVTVSAGGASTSLTSVGDTVQLTATALDGSNNPIAGATFSWRSDNTAVVTVLASGKVTAAGNGTANVFARSNGVESSGTAFTVAQAIASVSVLPSSANVANGGTQQFTASAKDARGNPIAAAPAATWQSSNSGVASVDSGGLATGTNSAAGTTASATITATISGVSGTAQISVSGPGY